MTPKKTVFLAGSLLLAFLLAACGSQAGLQEPCSAGTMLAAMNLSPQAVTVDPSKLVTFSWTHTDANCEPAYFEVSVGTALDGSAPLTSQSSQTNSLEWQEPLQPGRTYFWTVVPVLLNNGQTERGTSQTAVFFTGPVCTAQAALLAPGAAAPANDTSFGSAVSVLLRWEYPAACLPAGSYNLQVAGSSDFSTVLFTNQTGLITEQELAPGWIADLPQDCAEYYWRVRVEPGQGDPGAWSETRRFLLNQVGSACGLLEPSPTSSPVPSATATAVPQTPLAELPVLTAVQNVNCRQGPSPEYHGLDTLFRSWSAVIRGRNPDSTWWYINSPNIAVGYYCWVWGGAVTVSGDTSQIPVVTPPAPPSATPLPATATPVQ